MIFTLLLLPLPIIPSDDRCWNDPAETEERNIFIMLWLVGYSCGVIVVELTS